MTPRLLLVADDEEDNRVIFSAILTHHGFNVSLATDGQQAVDLAAKHAPDLILMDLQMPVLNGWEAVRLLKAASDTASIPVVAVTAVDCVRGDLEGAGFCAYVKKPIAPLDLVQVVELCLTGSMEDHPWIELPSFGSPLPPISRVRPPA